MAAGRESALIQANRRVTTIQDVIGIPPPVHAVKDFARSSVMKRLALCREPANGI
jgi:hypothetical protein